MHHPMMSEVIRYGSPMGKKQPRFALRPRQRAPSLHNLPTALTINGSTLSPDFVVRGGDASVTSWPDAAGGEAFSIDGSGSDPGIEQIVPPLAGPVGRGVLGNAGKYYSRTVHTGIGKEDYIFEAILNPGAISGTEYVICDFNPGVSGWIFATHPSDYLLFWNRTASGAVSVGSAGHAVTGRLLHVLVGCNRDENSTNGMVMCVDGGLYDTANAYLNYNETMDQSAQPFTILARGDGTTDFTGTLAWAALWHKDDLLSAGATGKAEVLAVAQDRFARLCGYYPYRAVGEPIPATMGASRNCVRRVLYYDLASSSYKLGAVGNHWPPAELLLVDGQDCYVHSPEGEATNHIDYSRDPASWDGGYNLSFSACEALDGSQDGTVWTENAANGDHLRYVYASALSVGTTYCMSAPLKYVGRQWVRMGTLSGALANTNAWFDLQNGVKGAKQSNVDDHGMIDLGGGVYRCWMVYSGAGSGAGHLLAGAAANGSSAAYVGLNGAAFQLLADVQLEEGIFPTSFIKSTGAITTRLADNINWVDSANLDANGGDGPEWSVKCRFRTNGAGVGRAGYLFEISDGGASSDRLAAYISGANGKVSAISRNSAGNDGTVNGNTVVMDGTPTEFTVIVRMRRDELRLYLDGAEEGTADTLCDPPNDLDTVTPGSSEGYPQYSLGNDADLLEFGIWDSFGGAT